VEPPIVSVFIKSDRLRRRVPKVGEMVRLAGRPGLFLVTRVDRNERVVDLMQKAGRHELNENVPFSSIRSLDKNVSVAVDEFLKSQFPSEDEKAESAA